MVAHLLQGFRRNGGQFEVDRLARQCLITQHRELIKQHLPYDGVAKVSVGQLDEQGVAEFPVRSKVGQGVFIPALAFALASERQQRSGLP